MGRVRFELIPDGVQEKEVSVNRISTQYWEIGDGEPLVFVHGGAPVAMPSPTGSPFCPASRPGVSGRLR